MWLPGPPRRGAPRAGTSRSRPPTASTTTTWWWTRRTAWSGRASTGRRPTSTASTSSPTRAPTTRRRRRPPTAARSQVNPANATASPFGWHDTNGAAGAEFNTTAGQQRRGLHRTSTPTTRPDTGSSPSGGTARNFDFALTLTQAPSAYRPAAVTNLFYWNNIIHDVQYQYGFDEAAGNFQVNNYGRRRRSATTACAPRRRTAAAPTTRTSARRPTDSARACRCSSGRRPPRTRTATWTTASSSTSTATGSPTAWWAAPAT